MSSWENPRSVLQRYGIQPQKKFSQNFLVAPHVVERILAHVNPQPGQCWIEIGPGPGTLTRGMLAAGARVHAVERDLNMIRILEREFHDLPLTVDHADATLLDYQSWGEGGLHVLGNLPYAVTGGIFRNLLDQYPAVDRCVFMVQREVAQRLCALPNQSAYGVLSVLAQAVYDCQLRFHVSPASFYPPPAVTSSVVELKRLATPRQPLTPTFVHVVRAAFGQRRKMLRQSLRTMTVATGGAGSAHDAAHVTLALRAAGVDETRRGETLSIEEFARLASALGQNDELG
jgi:16S rRNA (adenine1518-N6/adenine1519-N6)-dimethyltransferase